MGFKLGGVNPALVTPFTKEGELDLKAMEKLLKFVISQGVDGVVPCGSTGEFTYLSVEERKKLLEFVIEETKKIDSKVKVIAGTGGSSTKEALEMTKFAEKRGADAVLVCSPYYFKVSDRNLYNHYYCIAQETSIPIIIYNIPQLTGNSIDWRIIEDLAQLDSIVGLKDSSGNMSYLMTCLEKAGDKINIVCGWDEIVFPALAAGASGMILASANILPDIWVEIYNKMKKSKLEEARKLQFKIQKILRLIVKSGAVGVKSALKMMGLNVGKSRNPLALGGELSYEDKEELRIELEKLGKIEKEKVEVEIKPGAPLEKRFGAIGITPKKIKDFSLKIGEALSGSEPEVAHIEVLIGEKNGPVGEAFAKAKAAPSPGHEPLIAILEPNLPVKPATLIIPTVKVKNLRSASLIYGAAQAAVAKAVADTVKEGYIPEEEADNLLILASVFIHPAAVNRQRIYINNYKAMRHALRRAIENRPNISEILNDKEKAKHPLKYEP